MAKVESLNKIYPNATVLNINRCPGTTIPSTLALNNNIYRFFTSRRPSQEMDDKTRDILVEWYKMAHTNLNRYYPEQTLKIDFSKLICNDEAAWKMICDRLEVGYDNFIKLQETRITQTDHKSSNAYVKLNENELAGVLKEISFMQPYCKSVE